MLEELHFHHQDSFILAEVLSENPEWLLVKSYNELGQVDSYQLLKAAQLKKRLTNTPYLNYYQFVVEKRNELENFSLSLDTANLNDFLKATRNQVVTIFLTDDDEVKVGAVHQEEQDFLLTEFDYDSFQFGETYLIPTQLVERVVLDRRDSLLIEYLKS